SRRASSLAGCCVRYGFGSCSRNGIAKSPHARLGGKLRRVAAGILAPMKAVVTMLLLVAWAVPAFAQEGPPRDIAARVEVVTVSSVTLSDGQFLTGDPNGKPVTIAGVLRIPRGTGRVPLVVYLPPSS